MGKRQDEQFRIVRVCTRRERPNRPRIEAHSQEIGVSTGGKQNTHRDKKNARRERKHTVGGIPVDVDDIGVPPSKENFPERRPRQNGPGVGF